MKKYVTYFLVLMISFQPMWVSAADLSDLVDGTANDKVNLADVKITPEQELALLNTVRARVKMYMQVNKNLAEEILSCFNFSIAKETVTERCVKRMEHIRGIIRERYPRMRRLLLLYNMMSHPTMNIFVDHFKFHSKAPNRPYKYLPFPWSFEKSIIKVENPLEGWLSDNPLTGWTVSLKVAPVNFKNEDYREAMFGTKYGFFDKILETKYVSMLSLPIVTKTEKSGVAKNYSEYLKFMCLNGMDQPQFPKNLIDKSHCDKLRFYWDEKKNDGSFYLYLDHRGMSFEDEMKMHQSVFPAFYLNDNLRLQYAKEILEEYYAFVTTHPFLALVSSENPTDLEITHAFQKIVDSAHKNYNAFAKKFPKSFEGLDLDNQDRLIIMDYAPVIEHALVHPSIEMRMAGDEDVMALVSQKLSKERAMQQLKRAGKNILAMVGLNIACFLPWGRLLKVGAITKAGSLFKPLCISALTLPLGSYFIYESYTEFERTYNELFGVPVGIVQERERTGDELDTGEHTLNEMANLKSAEKFLLIDIVTAPIGSRLALQKLTSSGLRLTVKQKDIVVNAIENYRYAPVYAPVMP
jgi:hypothetical protein